MKNQDTVSYSVKLGLFVLIIAGQLYHVSLTKAQHAYPRYDWQVVRHNPDEVFDLT